MNKNRMEAFSDGVIAILITIMVLNLKAPTGSNFDALFSLAPTFLSYVLSFVFLGIYWNNHHHLLQAIRQVNGRVLWANLHLLFWLSLIPFVTEWMGENHFAAFPVALYGIVHLLAGVAYFLLTKTLLALHGKDSVLSTALGNDLKGKVSIVLWLAAILLCLVHPFLACGVYVAVAIIWLVPDSRIERIVAG